MRPVVVAAILASTGCVYAPDVLEHLADVEARVAEAQATESRACAPEALAHAEADLAFARLELGHGDLLRADLHLRDAEARAIEARDAGLACAPPPDDIDDTDDTDDTGDTDVEPIADAPSEQAEPEPAAPLPDLASAIAESSAPPPPDRDGDGVADAIDACPDVSETPNDYLDDDGCPDTAPARVRLDEDRLLLDGHLRFSPGAATLLPENDALLDDVRKVLDDAPYLHLRVEGHTDSSGEEADNLHLSQRRAEAVRAWLIEHGIPGTRITAEGFGETRPIDTNRTPTGRLNNRRIELHVFTQ